MAVTAHGSEPDSTPMLFFTDTMTGRVWRQFSTPNSHETDWHAYGSPAAKMSDRIPR